MKKDIKKIVITGGPCAGKSTGLSSVDEVLTKLGYKVYIIDEQATMFKTSGVIPGKETKNMDFQRAILEMQMAKERIYRDIAEKSLSSEKVIILCDRGALDGLAYCSREEFSNMLTHLNFNLTILRDEYDAIFHLKTAADGAEEFYTCENNEAREESPELARELDKKTMKAWTGHPHLRVIDNSTNFTTKINRLVKEILRFLGEPVPIEIERKFLIKMPDIESLLNSFDAEKVDILQTYLNPDVFGEEKRIRQRGNDGGYTYFLTTKKNIDHLQRIETEKHISQKEFVTLLMTADSSLRPIRKERYCFVYNNLYFELDVYPFWKDKAILEIELTEENQTIEIPEYIEVIKEVTDDVTYRNSSIAKIIPK